MTKPSVFDVHSENYRDTHDRHLPKGVKHDQFRIQKLEWVRSFLTNGAEGISLLDFGCNAGELCVDLSVLEPKLRIVGVDEAQESLRVAKEKSKDLSNIPTYFHSLSEINANEKYDLITWRGNHEHFANAGQHQGAERIVNEGLIVNGKQLLAHRFGNRIKSGAGPTRENNALHIFYLLMVQKS